MPKNDYWAKDHRRFFNLEGEKRDHARFIEEGKRRRKIEALRAKRVLREELKEVWE